MRTRRDVIFVIFAFLMSIFLPALSNIVNPSNWENPVALQFYKMPMFWIAFIMIGIALTVLFLWTRRIDEKIDGFDKETRKKLKESIQTLNKKLDKLDKLNKLDKLDKLDRLIALLEAEYDSRKRK